MNKYLSFTIGTVIAAGVASVSVSGCSSDTTSTDGQSEGDGSVATMDATTVDSGAPDTFVPSSDAGDGSVATTCGSLTRCSGTCVDTTSDGSNCGGCGNVCAAGQVCSAGACATSCQAGLVDCNGGCVDPKTSNAFCGAAGNCTNDHSGVDSAGTVCAAGTICSGNGTCQASCQPDEILCGTTCINPLVDPTFCGAKGSCANDGQATDSAGVTCAMGQFCTNGSCQATCVTGQVVCGNVCVDPETDPSHCGATAGCTGGVVCAGGQVCNHGACATTCQPDEVLCGTTCVNPLTNPGFCGAAGQCNAASGANTRGTACATGNVCANGTCAVSCPGATVNCGGTCIDANTNATFCGAAGNCTNDHVGADTAGTSCATGTACSGGSCTPNCRAGLSICNSACVDEQHDPAHCGGCSACAAEPSVTADVCRSGVCAVGTCATGTADCDGTFSNGCEVSTASSASNCGACGHACSTGFACSNGACVGPKTVFITSAVYGSNMGGLAGADARCQSSASSAGLAGTYKAWLSDDQGTPDTRFTHSPLPYKRVDGVVVANSFTSLTSGSLLAPIDVTETGGAPSASNFCESNTVKAWTDTSETGGLPPGAEGDNCTDWSGAGTSSWGLATATDSSWTVFCGGSAATCADQTTYAAHLYCFQQ